MTKSYEICLNCGKTIDIFAKDDEREIYYKLSFCCEKCQSSYYNNVLLKVATKLDLFPHIESRFEILDL